MKEQTKKRIIFWGVFGVVFVLFLICLSFLSIYTNVKTACVTAQEKHKQSCVESLMAEVKSPESSFHEKNVAVWALGQIADDSVLRFLDGLNAQLTWGERCNYSEELCKFEVEKAMKWCQDGNLTSWMYRNREEWIK